MSPAAVVSREHAHGHPGADGDEHCHDADEQGDAGAVHQAGQHVPSELVRAEEKPVAGRDGQPVGVETVGQLQHGVLQITQFSQDRGRQRQGRQEQDQAAAGADHAVLQHAPQEGQRRRAGLFRLEGGGGWGNDGHGIHLSLKGAGP